MVAADVAPFPIAHIPAVPDANDLSVLFSVPHFCFSLSLAFAGSNCQLRDPAAFGSGKLRGPCFPALAGDLGDFGIGQILCPCLSAKSCPAPVRAGFSFLLMPELSCLAISKSREKNTLVSLFRQPFRKRDDPHSKRTYRPSRRQESVLLAGYGRECGSESTIPALASVAASSARQSTLAANSAARDINGTPAVFVFIVFNHLDLYSGYANRDSLMATDY